MRRRETVWELPTSRNIALIVVIDPPAFDDPTIVTKLAGRCRKGIRPL